MAHDLKIAVELRGKVLTHCQGHYSCLLPALKATYLHDT